MGIIKEIELERILNLTGSEVKEHINIYKRKTALDSIKRIIENEKRLLEFGYVKEDFCNLDKDIIKNEELYFEWCKKIERKYGISINEKIYTIDYIERKIIFDV